MDLEADRKDLIRALQASNGRGSAVLKRALTFIEKMDATPQHVPAAQPSSVQDLLTRETLHVLRSEREHNLASEETKNDYAYIDIIGRIPGFKHVARMIALVARYAGELPHDLINPTMRSTFANHIDMNDSIEEQRAAFARLGKPLAEYTWEDFVDPGLAGNARIACYDIGQALPRLNGMDIEHVFQMVRDPGSKHAKVFMDYFCAVVAARWRANSVLAAQPYKTKNEQEAVMLALRESSRRLNDFALHNDCIKYDQRRPPTTLSELRGSGTIPAIDRRYTGGVRPY